MTLNASKVRVAVTGAVSAGPTGTTAPTDTATALNAAFVDLGYISEDGVTMTYPGSGDSIAIKAWQNGATVRTLRTPSEDVPTIQFTMIETKKETVELAFGVTVTQTVSEGSFEYDQTDTRTAKALVLDVIDGSELIRIHIPAGTVTEIGDQVFSNGAPIGFPVTIACDRDGTAGYNLKTFMTALKS